MKSIVNSQLTGKWYRIAHTNSGFEMKFLEVFVYLSISCEKCLDLLFVGIHEDRTKVLKKLSMRLIVNDKGVDIVLKYFFFRKKLKVLTLDKKNEIIIVADDKLKYLAIYSRKSVVRHEVIEKLLSDIDMNAKEISLFSMSISQ
ncbi:MAG: hypothetical protein E7068_08140 [Lentimicrobiaceae bacterium]|nr:hypothetical protein [Lentimicrobiaceae bacterium]